MQQQQQRKHLRMTNLKFFLIKGNCPDPEREVQHEGGGGDDGLWEVPAEVSRGGDHQRGFSEDNEGIQLNNIVCQASGSIIYNTWNWDIVTKLVPAVREIRNRKSM